MVKDVVIIKKISKNKSHLFISLFVPVLLRATSEVSSYEFCEMIMNAGF